MFKALDQIVNKYHKEKTSTFNDHQVLKMSWNGTHKNKSMLTASKHGLCPMLWQTVPQRPGPSPCSTFWNDFMGNIQASPKKSKKDFSRETYWSRKSISDISSGPFRRRMIVYKKGGGGGFYTTIRLQYTDEWVILLKTVWSYEALTGKCNQNNLGGLKFQVGAGEKYSCNQINRSLKDKLHMAEWPIFLVKVVNQVGLKYM